MGFLDFMKKGKKVEEAPPSPDMDVPPPPPDMDSARDNAFPEPPPLSDDVGFDMPSFPEPPKEPEVNLPPLGTEGPTFNLEDIPRSPVEPVPEALPPEKPAPEVEEAAETPEMPPVKPIEEPKPVTSVPEPAPEKPIEVTPSAREREPDFTKPLYVPMVKYREIEDNLDVVKVDLRKGESYLERFGRVMEDENLSMERLAKASDFALKKISFLDKKLFKGD